MLNKRLLLTFINLFIISNICYAATFSPQTGTDDGMRWTTNYRTTDAIIHLGTISGTIYQSNIRFPSVTIPQGSTINSAKITFICGSASSTNTVNIKVYAEDADDSDTIDDATEWDNAVMTTGTAWSALPAWTLGTAYDTPDISTEIQTVIDRAGWVSGNAIGIFLKDNSGTAARFYAAFDNATYTEPVLTITWTPPLDRRIILIQ